MVNKFSFQRKNIVKKNTEKKYGNFICIYTCRIKNKLYICTY